MRRLERHDLSDDQRELLAAAERASLTAHCPFSGFPVGAAIRVRTRSGETAVVTGTNSETANYRSVCAEKHAVHRALAEHAWIEDGEVVRPEVEAVAVYCGVGASPQQPCGDCRQTLWEVAPDVEVISASGPNRSGHHDPRVSVTTLRALLPHGFGVDSLRGETGLGNTQIHESERLENPIRLEDFVIHLPKPGEISTDAAHRRELLQGVRYLVVAGSPRRARRIAALAHERFGARRDAADCCYCDLTVPGRGESGREFAIYVPELPGAGEGPGIRIAVVSHGIGKAGVEIVLSEVPALLALAQDGEVPELRGVVRCGTRGTLNRVPAGSIALSTSCHDENLERLRPSSEWLEHLRAAARSRGMTVVAEEEIEARGENGWPPPAETLVEGPGISTSFFWEGQGRPLYRLGSPPPEEVLRLEQRERADLLESWYRAGIRWIEMEDFTVLRVAGLCGIPAASLGAVIGHRRRIDGGFQLDYNKEALAASELVPSEIVLAAIADDGG